MKQKKVVSMVCVLVLIISAVTLYSEEIRTSKYYGVHFITEIKENNVNIREAPSLEANVIVTLNEGHKIRITGISKVNEKIDGYSGYWFRIEILDFKAKELYPLGKWVFSKYVKDKDITPSIIRLKKSNEILNNQVSSLELLIEKNGRTRTVKVPVERKKIDILLYGMIILMLSLCTMMFQEFIDGFPNLMKLGMYLIILSINGPLMSLQKITDIVLVMKVLHPE